MRGMVIGLVVLAAAACGKSSTAAATADEIGTYSLVSVNGAAVPCNITEGSVTARITAGSLTFSSGGTVRVVTSFTVNGQQQGTDVSGTYTRAGSAFTMHYTNGGANTGTLSGTSFTMMNEGMAWVYARSASL